MLRCCDEAHLKRLGTTRAPVLADCHGLWSYVEMRNRIVACGEIQE